jgi:hypothetical protein
MTARSTYPIREGFFLDANAKIETTTKDVGFDLGNSTTLRIIVKGATVVQAAGAGTAATIQLKDTSNADTVFYTITSADLAYVDSDGVYIAHVRGARFKGISNVKYTYTAGTAGGGTAGAITGFSVYLDAVDVC